MCSLAWFNLPSLNGPPLPSQEGETFVEKNHKQFVTWSGLTQSVRAVLVACALVDTVSGGQRLLSMHKGLAGFGRTQCCEWLLASRTTLSDIEDEILLNINIRKYAETVTETQFTTANR
jgi:hypothetical protein